MRNLWKEQVAYLKDNPEGYWFKRKLYGWGWTPAKPAGWAVLGAYLLIIFGLVVCAEKTGCAEENPMIFFSILFATTILFLVVIWRTGESPKWQWGKHRD
jgi:hypothetical protein